jgi:hypothetical protein
VTGECAELKLGIPVEALKSMDTFKFKGANDDPFSHKMEYV